MDDAERYEILHEMVIGLHSLVFGVHSLKDPEYSHKALSDDGDLHSYVHAMIRVLPSRQEQEN